MMKETDRTNMGLGVDGGVVFHNGYFTLDAALEPSYAAADVVAAPHDWVRPADVCTIDFGRGAQPLASELKLVHPRECSLRGSWLLVTLVTSGRRSFLRARGSRSTHRRGYSGD